MFTFLDLIFELFVIGSSIFLIIVGFSKKEKYSANKTLKRSLLIIGIVILTLSIVTGVPELIKGFTSNS